VWDDTPESFQKPPARELWGVVTKDSGEWEQRKEMGQMTRLF